MKTAEVSDNLNEVSCMLSFPMFVWGEMAMIGYMENETLCSTEYVVLCKHRESVDAISEQYARLCANATSSLYDSP